MATGESTVDSREDTPAAAPAGISSAGHGGEGAVPLVEDPEHAHALVVQPGGRVSEARQVLPAASSAPFHAIQLARLDEALRLASRETGIRFTVYLGELGAQPRRRAEELHAMLGSAAASAVVIAVSPGERVVEVVTGEESGAKCSDRVCKLAVMSMLASFKEGDLVGGLVSGLHMMANQAGLHRLRRS